MYKQNVRANGHTLPGVGILWVISLSFLSVLRYFQPTDGLYNLIENCIIALNLLIMLWLLYVSRTEYVYQYIDRNLVIRKIRGRKQIPVCAIPTGSIQEVRPCCGARLLLTRATFRAAFSGDPLAFFSSYVMTYKTPAQHLVRVIFQPNRVLLSQLAPILGDKLTLYRKDQEPAAPKEETV